MSAIQSSGPSSSEQIHSGSILSSISERLEGICSAASVAQIIDQAMGAILRFMNPGVAAIAVANPVASEIQVYFTADPSDQAVKPFVKELENGVAMLFGGTSAADYPLAFMRVNCPGVDGNQWVSAAGANGSSASAEGVSDAEGGSDGPSSWVNIPIRAGSRTVGFFMGVPGHLGVGRDEIRQAALILTALGPALDNRFLNASLARANEYLAVVNVSLEQEKERQRLRFEAVCDLTKSIFDLKELLRRICDQTIAVVAASACAIYRSDRTGLTLLRGAPEEAFSAASAAAGQWGTTCVEGKKVISSRLSNPDARNVFLPPQMTVEHTDSEAHFIAIPLIVHESDFKASGKYEERVLGLVCLVRDEHLGPFSMEDLGLAMTLAAFAAIALEKAELYSERSVKRDLEQELDLARKIQEGFLPERPLSARDLDISAASISAKAIGGDFYDFFPLGNGFGAIIADVSGKGIAAALLTNMARSAIRAISKGVFEPGDLLEGVNNFICDDIDPYRFITLFCMAYDSTAGRIMYSNAGHPPMMIKRADGTILELTTPGPAVGIMRGVPFTQASIPLRSGDTLLMYTDGITEARSEGGEEFFGFGRLREVFSTTGGESRVIMDAILNAIRDFVGADPPHDDLTLVVLRRP